MADDGVDQVVLLPLYPHWSKTTSGSSIAYWHALEEAGEIPSWPTTSVFEYAAHPKYVQAVSERIDEALQRFPSGLRDDVHLLFSGYGTSTREVTEHGDPYRCHLRTTVEEVMNLREDDRAHDVAFQGGDGFTKWLSPSTSEVLERLGSGHAPPVLVVPISYLTDHVETHYELDIAVREEAEAAGIDHFEVSSGLNAHPLLVEALAEATVSQIRLPVDAGQLAAFENGQGDPVFPRTRNPQGETDADDPQRSCPADLEESAARRWTTLSPSESTASSVSSG
jgi:ferrochelatase